MSDPVVDVVIPIHTEARPIKRSTASVLSTAVTPVRVSVVCHNVAPPLIERALGRWAADPRVRLLHLEDGIASPAGPINLGLEAATAEFTSILGSDDEYEPGAIDAWIALARRDSADVVIPPLRNVPGGPTRSPPTRPTRSRNLDGVRDRLAYRTVQLGLVSRSRFGHVRMTPGLRTGEDVAQGASLWYSDARISVGRRVPGYLIHEDDPTFRVSTAPKPAEEALRFLDTILAPDFTEALTAAQREAFAIKLLRTHIMDVLGATLRWGGEATDYASLASSARRILEMAPSAIYAMSRREARIVRMLTNCSDDVDKLAAEHQLLKNYRLPANLLPASFRYALHREAPFRFLSAVAFMR